MKFLLGTKQHMTQVFDDKGLVRAGTVLSVGPMAVTQVKTKEIDGYDALQFGAGEQKERRLSKAVKGHLKGKMFRTLREVRTKTAQESVEVGAVIDASIFTPGDRVTVSALSKGKGFQGVVKRHGFAGGPRTHGQAHSEREGGSIGGGLRSRTPRNMKMPGRMGGDRVTVRNLTVLSVDPKANELIVSGAVPGRRGSLVEVKGV